MSGTKLHKSEAVRTDISFYHQVYPEPHRSSVELWNLSRSFGTTCPMLTEWRLGIRSLKLLQPVEREVGIDLPTAFVFCPWHMNCSVFYEIPGMVNCQKTVQTVCPLLSLNPISLNNRMFMDKAPLNASDHNLTTDSIAGDYTPGYSRHLREREMARTATNYPNIITGINSEKIWESHTSSVNSFLSSIVKVWYGVVDFTNQVHSVASLVESFVYNLSKIKRLLKTRIKNVASPKGSEDVKIKETPAVLKSKL